MGSLKIPFKSFCIILFNALTVFKVKTNVIFCSILSLLGCFQHPLCSLFIILLYAKAI